MDEEVKMIRRKRTKQKVIFIFTILGIIVIYYEYLIYEIQSLKWVTKDCHDCIKILLVADPQILGEINENYFGSWIARWDSDRYLEKTFLRALSHSKPNIIAFLGDLMDEGHIAITSDFIKYKNRWNNIFYTSNHIMKLFIPGDNDIGGEEDPVSVQIHNRFKMAFPQPDIIPFKNIVFFKVNKLINDIPKYISTNDYKGRNITKIILSHMPLLYKPGIYVKKVVEILSPQIIFTAHNHKASYISLNTVRNKLESINMFPIKTSSFYHFKFDNDSIYEFQIPTCSYRMGTKEMGYGLAYINETDNSMDFTILWLPERFPILKSYLYVLGIFIICIKLLFVYHYCWH